MAQHQAGRKARMSLALSLWLFNVFMDTCVNNSSNNIRGALIGGMNKSVFLYADEDFRWLSSQMIGRERYMV